MKKMLLLIPLSLLLTACGNSKKSSHSHTPPAHTDSVVVQGNKTTRISTQISELAKLIDLSNYTPNRVKFRHIMYDNSGNQDRMNIPGPSDDLLEAVLYFDSTEFAEVKSFKFGGDFPPQEIHPGDFIFPWLNDSIKTELGQSPQKERGHPDLMFGTQGGKLWMLDSKILLVKPMQ